MLLGSQTFSAWDPKEKSGVSPGPKRKETHQAGRQIRVVFGYKNLILQPADKKIYWNTNTANREFKTHDMSEVL